MRVSGLFDVNLPQEQVFLKINDTKLLASCIPGCSNVTQVDRNRYNADLQVDIAFLKLKFQVTVHLIEVIEPKLLRATINGKPVGLPGKLTGTAEISLESNRDGENTVIAYVLDQSLTGKFGGIGQSVFRAKAEEQGKQFADNLKDALTN